MVLPWLLLPLQVKCHVAQFSVQQKGHAFARAYQLSGPILDFALPLYLSCFCPIPKWIAKVVWAGSATRLYLLSRGH